ncbi:MAG: VUT family protein, partial [Planctomycetes bacterium]|nr:VUT family protein [Planctomycetota bacterium]
MSRSDRLYLFLAALFIAALVVTNLIANKFLTVDLGFRVFVLSAGALAYPLTFLVT